MASRIVHILGMIAVAGALSAAGMAHAQESTLSLEEYLVKNGPTYFCQVREHSDDRHEAHAEDEHFASQHKPSRRTRLVRSITVAKRILESGGYLGPCAVYGDRRSIGDGHFQTYVQLKPDGVPWAIGFEFPASTFNNLPTIPYDGQNCFDKNGNGVLEFDDHISENLSDHDECSGGHQRIIDFPLNDTIAPFKWGLINWQPHGHSPPDVYDRPHFDFHFYTQAFIERNYIRVGPCALLINCDDMATGQNPIPPQYIHPDFMDVGAVESRMGNHLIDVMAPEWNGGDFTETWLYGAYAGKLTFWEPMITLAYLESQPFMCKDIKLPEAYAESGVYPTEYCVRYRNARNEYTVSLEGFVYHEAQ